MSLTIYSTRHEFVDTLADGFMKLTGVPVIVELVKADAAARMVEEGRNCRADIVITVDFRRLIKLADLGLLGPVASSILEQSVPESLRDPAGRWFAQSMRVRMLLVRADVVQGGLGYDDLGDIRWRDQLSIRSPQHMFNTALIASYLATSGEEKTRAWLSAIAANRPHAPGGDRKVARLIAEGVAKIGVCNSYYYGEMKSGKGGPEQRDWVASVVPVMPTLTNGRTPVNITGAGVAAHAPNRPDAIAFLEYLASEPVQRLYADLTHEYPVRPGIPASAIMQEAGQLVLDDMSFSQVAACDQRAIQLADEVPWG